MLSTDQEQPGLLTILHCHNTHHTVYVTTVTYHIRENIPCSPTHVIRQACCVMSPYSKDTHGTSKQPLTASDPVLQSPERRQARLEELAGGVERERALVGEAERRSRDLQARMDTIAKVCCACNSRLCILHFISTAIHYAQAVYMYHQCENEVTWHLDTFALLTGDWTSQLLGAFFVSCFH